ncbi:MAG: flocculation-associated PEP-CTERM protein PepA [Pseudomonadota bacterium]
MKALLSKKVIAGAAAALSLFASAGASASTYNQFEIKEPTRSTAFQADRIIGGYTEVITFNPTDPLNPLAGGTFDVSLKWSASAFFNGGPNAVPSLLNAFENPNGYGLYALYTASGTFSGNGTQTTFNFTQGSGGLTVYMDLDQNTVFTNPGDGTQAFGRTGISDDIILATGQALSGSGTLDLAKKECPVGNPGDGGINCGSFGSTTGFDLYDNATGLDGKDYFVAPNPFYNLSFQSGQLNRFSPTGTVVIDGSMDVVFGEVPEPASLGLLGLGLLGLGAAGKRRKQAK